MISYFESKHSVDKILLNLMYVHVALLTINKVPFQFESELSWLCALSSWLCALSSWHSPITLRVNTVLTKILLSLMYQLRKCPFNRPFTDQMSLGFL